MACYDPETEELQSVCRVMSGFSDSFYQEATARRAHSLWEKEGGGRCLQGSLLPPASSRLSLAGWG